MGEGNPGILCGTLLGLSELGRGHSRGILWGQDSEVKSPKP